VPEKYKEDPSLGRWVCSQRALFKAGKMGPERKRMLEEIGFEFTKTQDENWNVQFKKLRDYHAEHGHCEFCWAVDRCSFLLNAPTNTPPVYLPALQAMCHTSTRKTRNWLIGLECSAKTSKMANWIRNEKE
jgi:hypothetical protein